MNVPSNTLPAPSNAPSSTRHPWLLFRRLAPGTGLPQLCVQDTIVALQNLAEELEELDEVRESREHRGKGRRHRSNGSSH